MKYTNNFYITLALVSTISSFFIGCNNHQKADGNGETKKDTSSVSTSADSVQKDSVGTLPSKVLELKSSWDSIRLHKISKQSDTIVLHNNGFKNLNAEIASEKPGNIRINQIIMPDNTSDGPFGKDLAYKLDQQGTYKLIIGESLMQGDPFEGDYVLKAIGN